MTEKTQRFAALVIAVLLLVVLLAGSGTAAWATPGQDRLRQTIPTPVPGDYFIVLPPQQDGNDYSFDFRLLPDVDCPPPAGCQLFEPFSLDAYLGTELIYPVTFNPPLEICFQYTTAEAAAVGGAENLMLAYWDDDRESWVPLDNWRIDEALMRVCGDISFVPATACGLAVTCAISPTGVPITGQPPAAPLAPETFYLVLGAAGLLAIAFVASRRLRVG